MTYEQLRSFIEEKMRMSHVYQPAMILCLLENEGTAPQAEIAETLLSYDDSQKEYYGRITRDMVGRVLLRHGIVDRNKQTREYKLDGFAGLGQSEIEELKDLCRQKIAEFIDQRGRQVFEHRKRSSGYISGTVRYDVLKRARSRCELCGISHEIKALEVDHIVPRNSGGSDDLSNLQALCYSCNAMKRDRDDTDFRDMRDSYETRASDCVFCTLSTERIVAENELALAIQDGFPVSPLHTLVIPKRHIESYFDLGQAEINACTALLKRAKASLEREDPAIDGFNVGINNGDSAGQTVPHCHIHLIPRRSGDVPQPRGGVRNTIPGKGNY